MHLPFKPLRALRAILFAIAAGLTASALSSPLEPAMKDNPLLTNLRPWCIGRLVFDRSVNSDLHYEKYEYAGSDIVIKPNVSPPLFKRIVDARERELRTKRRVYTIPYKEKLAKKLPSSIVETDKPWLEWASSPSPQSRLFIFKKDEILADGLFKEEGYILAGTNQLTLTGQLGSTAVQEVIQNDSEWYRATTYLDDWAIPAERGFCIRGALFGGVPRSTESLEQTFLLLPGRPATFIVKMRSSLDVDQQNSLLKTVPDLRRRLSGGSLFGGARILREGKREFSGMQAEEVLLSMKDNGVQTFQFFLVAPGTEDNRAHPYTEIRLILGAPPRDNFPADRATSPVDEAGALQAWDTLLNSFRLRPMAI